MPRHAIPPRPDDDGPRHHHHSRPTAPQQQQQPRPLSQHRAQSRFLEGSMNDRASAAPPPSFLGTCDERQSSRPLERAAVLAPAPGAESAHYQHYHQPPPPAGNLPRRPGTAAGSGSGSGSGDTSGRRGGFLAPLWDGLQQRFGIARSRSSNSIGIRERDTNLARNGLATHHEGGAGVPATADAAADSDRPTREEVLQSYQSLMASGFFNAHAIKSTRQPGPGGAQQQPPPVPPHMTKPGHAGDRRSAPTAVPSFAQRVAQQDEAARPARASLPTAIAYPPATHSTSMQPPPTRPADCPTRQPPPPPPSPQRGMKRPRPDAEEDHPSAARAADPSSAPAATETGARKLVKRLRKSASRVSVELSLSRPPTAATGEDGALRVPRRSVSIVRSLSASWRGEPPLPAIPPAAAAAAAPSLPAIASPPAPPPPAAPYPSGSASDRNRLKKRDIRGRRSRRSRSRSAEPKSPSQHQQQHQRPRSRSRSRSRPATARSSSPAPLPIMRPESRGCEMEGVEATGGAGAGGFAAGSAERPVPASPVVPSFHYPRRVRPAHHQQQHQPLSVVPDANRGVPAVPRVPRKYEPAGRENEERVVGGW
ncbi:hypothetical protein NKR23_g7596 [Pleurostoma richardsiae]|uniref:Uncharacterized protein n=1 Tax=Pleurostoma richardsiae TaxID=41990 RepID=A0AA38RA27_9PEZI|nr:hypothetical protein NKR23_g7596 [Pleurostoma richardsiae]